MADGCDVDSVDSVLNYINNTVVGEKYNAENVKNQYEKFRERYLLLQQQLTFASQEAPGKIENALKEAERCRDEITRFGIAQEQIHGDICNHSADSANIMKKLVEIRDQIRELQVYSTYLQWISSIDDLSADIQSALLIESQQRAVEQFNSLAQFTSSIQSSKCKHLVEFANASVLFWYQILKDRLTSEFDDILRAWGWPFIMTTSQSKQTGNEAEVKKKLDTVFIRLIQLQLPEGLAPASQTSHKFNSATANCQPLLLPFEIILLPLRKRFRFHFFGRKQTNALEKPEWYFTQVLTWMRDHREFLEGKIQPLLSGVPGVVAMIEFSRGLVAMVMDKIEADLEAVMCDDGNFCHLVDEVLAFERDLKEMYNYPSSQPSPLCVLTKKDPLNKWLSIEKKNALDKMDAILSSPTAWQSQYKDVSNAENLIKVPECAEMFMTLMTTILDRFKGLPRYEDQNQFLSLQQELFEDYRQRLVQVKTKEIQNPVYTAVLNTVTFMHQALKEWGEMPFFVALHHWKCQEEKTLNVSKGKEQNGVILPDENFCGTVFDETIHLLQHLQTEMLAAIVTYVADDVKARSRPYRKEKWLVGASHKDLLSLSLSPSACEMLLVLKNHLHATQELLSAELFTSFWQMLAAQLDHFIFQQVILDNFFNESGAHQLNFDMTRNFFPLFGQYTQKPENYFKCVKEACKMLSLNAGAARLLKGVIYDALHNPQAAGGHALVDPIAALHDIGVFKLDADQAEYVLSRRADLSDV